MTNPMTDPISAADSEAMKPDTTAADIRGSIYRAILDASYADEGVEKVLAAIPVTLDQMSDIAAGRARVDEGWQPIETAPKADRYTGYDERRVLLLTDGRCKIGVWDDDRHAKTPRPFWSFEGDRISESRAKQPTHYMPLPSPPKVSP